WAILASQNALVEAMSSQHLNAEAHPHTYLRNALALASLFFTGTVLSVMSDSSDCTWCSNSVVFQTTGSILTFPFFTVSRCPRNSIGSLTLKCFAVGTRGPAGCALRALSRANVIDFTPASFFAIRRTLSAYENTRPAVGL